MGKKRVLVSYGVDIDAIAGWLGSYKGEDSQSDISRGNFLLVPTWCLLKPLQAIMLVLWVFDGY